MTALSDMRRSFDDFVIDYDASRCDEFTPHFPIHPLSPGERGALIGALNRELGGDGNRKQFLKALTGFASSKDLTDAEWWALKHVLEYENVGGAWAISTEAAQAARQVIAEAMQSPGQMELFG